jgi:hypothetical protein
MDNQKKSRENLVDNPGLAFEPPENHNQLPGFVIR